MSNSGTLASNRQNTASPKYNDKMSLLKNVSADSINHHLAIFFLIERFDKMNVQNLKKRVRFKNKNFVLQRQQSFRRFHAHQCYQLIRLTSEYL